MEETWTNRDLPVLRAAVQIYEDTGIGSIRSNEIEAATGFDKQTVQRALNALYTEPYFQDGMTAASGMRVFVGAPTGGALRAAGQWPTPENMLARLIGAFEAAAEDGTRDEPERKKFRQAALWLGSFAQQVAIGALGGAGGHILGGA